MQKYVILHNVKKERQRLFETAYKSDKDKRE